MSKVLERPTEQLSAPSSHSYADQERRRHSANGRRRGTGTHRRTDRGPPNQKRSQGSGNVNKPKPQKVEGGGGGGLCGVLNN